MTFDEACKLTTDEAREYLEMLRLPNDPACPRCDGNNVARIGGTKARPGLMRCRECPGRPQFTVTMGTIFEDSHIELRQWFMAFCQIYSSQESISAHQLDRVLRLGSYKSAWRMAHRIQHAMTSEPMRTLLSGTIEMDDVYIGGKPKPHMGEARRGLKKTPIAALVQRNGPLRAKVMQRVTGKYLKATVSEAVDTEKSRLMTDEFMPYMAVAKLFGGRHERVKHSAKENVRRVEGGEDVPCNTAESWFALLQRGVHGTFHHVGKQHLQRYCDEFAFRWNHRKVTDGERTEAALRLAPGKRLAYTQIA